MTRRLPVSLGLALILALALAGCRKPARPQDPFVALIAHTDQQIKILQDDAADPAKALRELQAYQEKNGAEIERLKQDVGALMQKDPMKAAAASAVYGMKSAELDGRTKEAEAKAKAK